MSGPSEPGLASERARALVALGTAAWTDRRSADAVRLWRAAAAAAPALAAPYLNLAGAGVDAARLESRAAKLAPDEPAVARNLGVLADRRGDAELALRRLKRAGVLAPAVPSTAAVVSRHSLIRAGEQAGRDWAARAAVLAPADIPLRLASLTRLLAAGRLSAALSHARAVLVPPAQWPSEFLDLVVDVHVKAADPEVALPLVGLAVERAPMRAAARVVSAMLHRRSGLPAEALAQARRAAILDPASFDAAVEVAAGLGDRELAEKAVSWFRRCGRLEPGRRGEIAENHAASLHEAGDSPGGAALLRRRLADTPERAQAYVGLSALAQAAQDLGLAERRVRHALMIRPDLPEALYQLAAVHRHQGRSAESRRLFERLRDVGGCSADHAFVHALLELGEGDPVAGVAAYEGRWQVPRFPKHRRPEGPGSLGSPRWRGEERPDATLAVWGEQGVGDELWFAGYLACAAKRVGRIVLEVAPHLVTLLQRSFPAIDVRARGATGTEKALAAADLQIPIGGLMLHCGAGAAPVPTGYLSADPARAARLRDRYTGGRSDVRVLGLAWRSVKPSRHASFEAPLPLWKPIFDLPGTVFVSLQYGDVAADARAVEEVLGRKLLVDEEIDASRDLDALAAQVAAVDRVVSIANSTVAVAHGLGRPVHVLLRAVQEDWRYARRKPVTRWLPTARCAWMRSPGGWLDPVTEVAELLRQEDRARDAGASGREGSGPAPAPGSDGTGHAGVEPPRAARSCSHRSP